jgi:hypothetical protein
MMKDHFKRTPEFLAAFHHIVANGFFESLSVQCNSREGRIYHCIVTGVGMIPSKAKYAATGVAPLIDPEKMIEAARNQVAQGRKLRNCHVEVKTEDWPLWSKDENTILGSKGTRTSLSISITLKI